MATRGPGITEAEFIYFGMNKDKWPCLTPETIQSFLDDPTWLDREDNEDFVECFFYYYDWFWTEQRCRL